MRDVPVIDVTGAATFVGFFFPTGFWEVPIRLVNFRAAHDHPRVTEIGVLRLPSFTNSLLQLSYIITSNLSPKKRTGGRC